MAAAERLYTVVFIFTGANETENNHTPPFFCQRKFFLYYNLSHSTASHFRNRRQLGRNRIPQAAT